MIIKDEDMKKNLSKIFAVLACALVALHLTACTPTKSDGEDGNSEAGLEIQIPRPAQNPIRTKLKQVSWTINCLKILWVNPKIKPKQTPQRRQQQILWRQDPEI